jgi:hypothetical protein
MSIWFLSNIRKNDHRIFTGAQKGGSDRGKSYRFLLMRKRVRTVAYLLVSLTWAMLRTSVGTIAHA